MNKSRGKVYLIGAGCHDDSWLTLRAAELLRKADAVVCDSLVSPSVLRMAENATIIHQGKRGHQSSARQQDIHQLLLDLTAQHEHVVRLQGGDPMIFGRGMEEIEALNHAGVDVEIVPGISSFSGIPAKVMLGLTCRDISSGFMVLTATGAHLERPEKEWKSIAAFSGTLVFLMGMSQLESISSHLIEAGKDPQTECAIISSRSSTLTDQVCTTLDSLKQAADDHQLYNPAVILIGGTAGLLKEQRLPRIGLAVSDLLAGKIKDHIHTPAQFEQVLDLEYRDLPADPSMLNCDHLPDWIVLTSAHGVDVLMKHLRKQKTDLRTLSHVRFALIGKESAARLEEYGLYADLVPDHASSSDLADALEQVLHPGDRVLLAQSMQAIPVLKERLSALDSIHLEILPLYDLEISLCDSNYLPERVQAWEKERISEILALDLLVVGSRAEARALLDSNVLDRTGTVVAISKAVAGVLQEAAYEKNIRILAAENPDAASIAQCIEKELDHQHRLA